VAAEVPSGELTPVEQSLVEHVCRGEWLDLAADDEAADEAAMRSWGDDRTCRAAVIRDILCGRLAPDPDPHGLRLRGARISGQLDLEHLSTDVNLELRDCLLKDGVLARDAQLASVRLTQCRIEQRAGPPLDAARLTCRVLDLRRARIVGQAEGAVNLIGAHIGGQLYYTGAELRTDSGPALDAERLKVDQAMFLHGFTATGSGERGAVRLTGAHIGGQLDCSGAKLRNDSGPALVADGLQVGQGVLLGGGFTARGLGEEGAVDLNFAHIGGNLDCAGATLCNGSGTGLRAYRLQVDGDISLTRGFIAAANGDRGAVRLTGAHIGGNLDCAGATLFNDGGPALLAYGVQVAQDIYLTKEFAAIGAGDKRAVVDLRAARVGGTFYYKPKRVKHNVDPRKLLAVDGLTYSGVPETNPPHKWQNLLRYDTPRYSAQPYQQIAAGYRALGNERQAREILMAQRDDELARGGARPPERLWGWITKVTLGYGYQPWRALLFLAGVVVVSCVLAVTLGAHGALAQTDKTAIPGRSCTVVQQVSLGLDLNLPVGTSVARADCDLTKDSTSATAAWLSAVGWVLRLAAWAFAALFIAGFTTAVRKT
jgi:hypothetical protein